jgi:hypothetical protein
MSLNNPGTRTLFGLAALGCLMSAGCGGPAATTPPDEEEKAARAVAEHYLEAFVSFNPGAMRAVSTPEHQKLLRDPGGAPPPPPKEKRLSWAVTSAEVLPGAGQAKFKGTLSAPGEPSHSFGLLLEKQDGKWKVASFNPDA